MDIKKLKYIIENRGNLDLDDDFAIKKRRKEITDILSKNIDDQNIDESVKFFEDDCTDEAFYWLGEAFDDVIYKTQSRKLLETMKERLK